MLILLLVMILTGIPEIVLNSTCRKNNKGNEVLNVLCITFN